MYQHFTTRKSEAVEPEVLKFQTVRSAIFSSMTGGELQEQGRWFVYIWYQSGIQTARLVLLYSNAVGDVSEIEEHHMFV
jgi:hypothetical protein